LFQVKITPLPDLPMRMKPVSHEYPRYNSEFQKKPVSRPMVVAAPVELLNRNLLVSVTVARSDPVNARQERAGQRVNLSALRQPDSTQLECRVADASNPLSELRWVVKRY